jgi:hypothetical protein
LARENAEYIALMVCEFYEELALRSGVLEAEFTLWGISAKSLEIVS